ncbi:hypothetical protein [Pseudomonas tolaasii]|uniref:hypothetical protein n=1 Tax=Pseudomonas tolaasii TaxID=29442 RepID=UPI001C5D79AD|nr:hypothetical protein [Pseudomonas tolaasii]MBW4793243.1 hypothetical protein [Pseudomonas tolaasii]
MRFSARSNKLDGFGGGGHFRDYFVIVTIWLWFFIQAMWLIVSGSSVSNAGGEHSYSEEYEALEAIMVNL